MARQASLQELLSQQRVGASHQSRRIAVQEPPENYDEDQALRQAIEESLKDVAASPARRHSDIGSDSKASQRTDHTSRDIAELESRPWQPDHGQSMPESEEEEDKDGLVGGNLGPDNLRRISIGRERSRSVQPICMATTVASCLFTKSSPRKRSTMKDNHTGSNYNSSIPRPKHSLLEEVMNSDHEEDEESLDDIELGSAMGVARGPVLMASRFPRSGALRLRSAASPPRRETVSSQRHRTCLTVSPTPSPRKTIEVNLVSSDEDTKSTSSNVDELSRELSLDVFKDKATTPPRKSRYPTAQDIVAAVRRQPSPSSSVELLDRLDPEAPGTATTPWMIGGDDKDVVLDTPQARQRLRNYEMILDSDQEEEDDDMVLVQQPSWHSAIRRTSGGSVKHHLDLPRIEHRNIAAHGRRSILALASDTEDDADIQLCRSPLLTARSPSRRGGRRRSPSVIMLESQKEGEASQPPTKRQIRISKPRRLRLSQVEDDDSVDESSLLSDNSSHRPTYQSQEEIVYGSVEFKLPSSLEEAPQGQNQGQSDAQTEEGEEERVQHSSALTPTDNSHADEKDQHRAKLLEQLQFSDDDHDNFAKENARPSSASPVSSEPLQLRGSLKRKAREMDVDEFAQFPHLSRPTRERRVVARSGGHGSLTDDEDDGGRMQQFMESLRSPTKVSLKSSSRLAHRHMQQSSKAGSELRNYDGDDECHGVVQEDKEDENEEETLEDPRIRRRSFPSPAKKTRIDLPQTSFILPKEQPAMTKTATTAPLHDVPSLSHAETIESISTLTQSQFSGLPASSFGGDVIKSTLDDIELFSDDEPSQTDKRDDQEQERKTRRYSALEFADRPAVLVNRGAEETSARAASSSVDAVTPRYGVTSVRREQCPLCGEMVPIDELGDHVEREVAAQERSEQALREQQDAELAMALGGGYQSQEDLVISDHHRDDEDEDGIFSSQVIPDSSSQGSPPPWVRPTSSAAVKGLGRVAPSSSHKLTQSRLTFLTQAPSASQMVAATASTLLSPTAPSRHLASEDSPSRRIQQLSLQSPPSNTNPRSSSSTPGVIQLSSASNRPPVRHGSGGRQQPQQQQQQHQQDPDYIEVDDDYQYQHSYRRQRSSSSRYPIVIPSQNDSDFGRSGINDSITSSYSQMAFGIQPGQILPTDSDLTTAPNTQSSYGGRGGGLLFSRHASDSKDDAEEIGQDGNQDKHREDELSQVLAPISLDDRDVTPAIAAAATAAIDTTTKAAQDEIVADDDGNGDDDDDFVHQPAPASMISRPFRTTKTRQAAATAQGEPASAKRKQQPKVRLTKATIVAAANNGRKKANKQVSLDDSDSDQPEGEVNKASAQTKAKIAAKKSRTRSTGVSTSTATATITTAKKKKTSVLDSILPAGVRRTTAKAKVKSNTSAAAGTIVVASQGEDEDEMSLESRLLKNKRSSKTAGIREKLWHPEDDLSDSERLDRRQVMGIGVGGIIGGVGAVPGRVTPSKLVREREEQERQQKQQEEEAKQPSQELSTRAEYFYGADGDMEYGYHSQEDYDRQWDGGAETRNPQWQRQHQQGGDGASDEHVPFDNEDDADDGGMEGQEGDQSFDQFFEQFDATFQPGASGSRRRKPAATTAGEAARGGGTRRGRGRSGTRDGANVHQMLFGRGVGPIQDPTLDPTDPFTANFRSSSAAAGGGIRGAGAGPATTANGSLAVRSTPTEQRKSWGYGKRGGRGRGRAWYARARRNK